ncbi:MAG TPA: PadR family transcriptional regulator [Streptosporangiaceae bacterium]|nr:PadR family transcriptional regulator [Streptosporangiaceae bacterium]
MSPVFRHGGLRLYLLKLLDEAPRHGYDVIRLLQDRFLGVYSPSPGTIYPRLARLEEEGLVTHEVIDGKKVYKITDAGRAELHNRRDDLADLEDELSASVRDIAREITRDVRETVRSLRDEFTWAIREAGRTGNDPRQRRPSGDGGAQETDHARAAADQAQDRADAAQAEADAAQAKAEAAQERADEAHSVVDDVLSAQGEAVEADTAAEEAAAEPAGHADGAEAEAGASGESVWSKAAGEGAGDGKDAGPDEPAGGRAGGRQRRFPSGGWREWAEWAERGDWREWTDWAEQRDWREWAGKQDWKERAKASHQEWKEWAKAGKQEWAASGRGRKAADRELVIDLERLAAAFAREIRGVAWQAETLSEDAVGNLSRILSDALNRIRTEVFRPQGPGEKDK